MLRDIVLRCLLIDKIKPIKNLLSKVFIHYVNTKRIIPLNLRKLIILDNSHNLVKSLNSILFEIKQ